MSFAFITQFQRLPRIRLILVFMLSGFVCQNIWAAQDAIVMVDRAVIYADESMSAPIGFVRKGRRIKVGDIARNKAQVYPIIVSGKVGYIRVLDVSTEKESVESERLLAERFHKASTYKFKSNTSLAVFMYASQIGLSHQNGELADNDGVTWTGLSLRGGVQTGGKWELDFLMNYLSAEEGDEGFRAFEIGFGGGYRIFEKGRFITRISGQLLGIPYSSYALGDLFRVNGTGYSAGLQVSLSYRFTERWALEAIGGVHYTKLYGIEPPAPYQSIEPSFAGSRLGLGVNYAF